MFDYWRVNQPFGNDLYHQFMVMTGGWFKVHYCLTHSENDLRVESHRLNQVFAMRIGGYEASAGNQTVSQGTALQLRPRNWKGGRTGHSD